jgi:hypothetical protein
MATTASLPAGRSFGVCGSETCIWWETARSHLRLHALLGDEFEQLWLASPAGVFSLADAAERRPQRCRVRLAHAAYYSVHRSFRLNLRILLALPATLFECSSNHTTPTSSIHPSNITTAHA